MDVNEFKNQIEAAKELKDALKEKVSADKDYERACKEKAEADKEFMASLKALRGEKSGTFVVTTSDGKSFLIDYKTTEDRGESYTITPITIV